jgi:1-deoxy-D-xylulose-5-phosphate synthase
MLRTALEQPGPAAIRYPKGAAREVPDDQVGSGLLGRKIVEGDGEVCVLAVGKMVEPAEEAAVLLAADDIHATVWDVRVVRPLDHAMIADAARHQLVVTVEDGIRVGGAGSHLADAIADIQEDRHSPPVVILGTPAAYIPHGSPAVIHAQLGLDGPGIAAAVHKARHHAIAPLSD